MVKQDVCIDRAFHIVCLSQVIHDGGTLANKKKFQVFGIQFVDVLWRANIVICFAFRRCLDGTDAAVAEDCKRAFLEVSKKHLSEFAGLVVQDRAAKGVSDELGMEEQEVCNMHDGTVLL